MEIRRGDIVFCKLREQPLESSLQAKDRPVLVVSNDKNNLHSTVFTGVPLTTKEKKYLPTHVKIAAVTNKGLKKDSIALCEQVTSFDKEQILDADYGRVNEHIMKQVARALQIQMELNHE